MDQVYAPLKDLQQKILGMNFPWRATMQTLLALEEDREKRGGGSFNERENARNNLRICAHVIDRHAHCAIDWRDVRVTISQRAKKLSGVEVKTQLANFLSFATGHMADEILRHIEPHWHDTLRDVGLAAQLPNIEPKKVLTHYITLFLLLEKK